MHGSPLQISRADTNSLRLRVCGQEVSYQIKQGGAANNNSWITRAQGGAHMGDILAAGRAAGQGLPVGASPLPGFGLLLQVRSLHIGVLKHIPQIYCHI